MAPLDLGIIGSGNQAEAHIEALRCVLDIRTIKVAGRNDDKVKAFVEQLKSQLDIPIASASMEDAARNSNVLVTCTPSTTFFVQRDWIQPGTFIAAVGADSPGKNELDPEIFRNAKVVGDIKAQIIKVGESQHAIKAGLIGAGELHGELGELVTGKIDGRVDENEITIYDSTGTALQDVACAAFIYEKLKDNAEIVGIDLFA